MIPLKNRTPRNSAPVVTVGLIVANTLVFLYELTLPNRVEQAFFMSYAMVPTRFVHLLGAPHVPLETAMLPLFTSMFLHAGWLHLIGNMWFLWIFGGNVEDQLGHVSYLIFYLVCGLGAGLTYVLMSLHSGVPSLGASGAISGVLGAFIVQYPRGRILTLIPLIIFWFTWDLPAFLILGYWFAIQFLSGISSVGSRVTGGVAWWAHIGGFLLGLWLVHLWPQRRRAGYYMEPS